MKPTYIAPPAPVAPPVAAPAAPPAPVAPLGPAISAGGPIGPIPITTGDKLASTLLPPPAHWLSQPKAKNNTLGNISISK